MITDDEIISPAKPPRPRQDPTAVHHHVVTLHHKENLDGFYHDMEGICTKPHVPTRACKCVARRPTSRSTDYDITAAEAVALLGDPRVSAVELHPSVIGAEVETHVTQYSQYFNKSTTNPTGYVFSSASNVWINWGLLRVYEGNARANWGSNASTMATGNVVLNTIGRDVDVVICDAGTIPSGHPEYAVNPDGSGGSRVVQFNWYQYNVVVNGDPNGTFTYDNASVHYHSVHVAGTAAGNTQGWSRGSNIYTCPYTSGGDPPYCFGYITEWHNNKPVDPNTGMKNPTVVNNSWGYAIPYNSGTRSYSGWNPDEVQVVIYRGVTYSPAATVTNGYNGICGTTQEFGNLGNSLVNSGQTITTGSGNSVTVTSTSSTLYGISGLTASSTPTYGDNEIGYWTLTLPFSISYLGTSYSTIYLNGTWGITFGNVSPTWLWSRSQPSWPKICFSAADSVFHDRRINTVYYGSTGTVGSRIYVIHALGSTITGSLSNDSVFEIWFYEAEPDRIDIKFGANGSAHWFTREQLEGWGFLYNKSIPQTYTFIDEALADMTDAGVITVGSAGNSSWKCDVPGGLDYDNQFKLSWLGNYFYYMRGSSPGNYGICVGAVGDTLPETKASYSNCGPGITVWSPGTLISSSEMGYHGYPGEGARDPRDIYYRQYKLSGTSMASPQVCGVIASALEFYPRWQQSDAEQWVVAGATQGQLTDTGGGYTDLYALQGSPNLYLYYPQLVPTQGQVVPTQTYGNVPSTGQVYPRPRIFIYGT